MATCSYIHLILAWTLMNPQSPLVRVDDSSQQNSIYGWSNMKFRKCLSLSHCSLGGDDDLRRTSSTWLINHVYFVLVFVSLICQHLNIKSSGWVSCWLSQDTQTGMWILWILSLFKFETRYKNKRYWISKRIRGTHTEFRHSWNICIKQQTF